MMTSYDSSSQAKMTAPPDIPPSEQASADLATPFGVSAPTLLAHDGAAGRLGAAWRLLYLIMENDPRAVIAVSSMEDDRLAHHLLEFIAIGTWAGKPFVLPRPLRSALARTKMSTLFLPESGTEPARAEHVLLSGMSDKRPGVRETAAHILGIVGSRAATPQLIAALQDPVPAVKIQAAKALGRVGGSSAVPALLKALPGSDEQMSSQIFTSLVQLGHAAVPALIEASTCNSTWMRWHCLRALGEIGDGRALPAMVNA